MDTAILWLIPLICCLIIEVLTDWLVFLCLAVGCLAGILSYWCGGSMAVQIIAMSVLTLITAAVLLPLARRWRRSSREKAAKASGMGALMGRTAVVSQRIQGAATPGRVKVDGDNWQAVCPDGATINPGAQVEIIGYDSIILQVKQINQ